MTVVKETQARTLVKLLVYRGIIVFTTFFISLLFGASFNEAVIAGLISLPIGTVSYYIHERGWLFLSWFRNIGVDSKFRSLLKTITYRLFTMFAIFATGRIIFIENNITAAEYTLAIMVNGLIIFYIIERIFNKIEWGKIHNKVA